MEFANLTTSVSANIPPTYKNDLHSHTEPSLTMMTKHANRPKMMPSIRNAKWMQRCFHLIQGTFEENSLPGK